MPGNSDNNGNIIWFQKTVTSSLAVAPILIVGNETISGLYASNIQTDIVNLSLKVQSGNQIFLHIMLDSITSVDLIGNILQLNSIDEIPFTLSFVDAIEASTASTFIENAINGQAVPIPNSILTLSLSFNDYRTNVIFDSSFTYPCLIFANNIALGKVNSQADAVNLLAQFGNGTYTVNIGSDSKTFIFSYTKENTNSLPKSIFALTTYFTCNVNASIINFLIDYLSTDKFWLFYDNKVIQGSPNQTISFINQSNNSFDLFYSNDILTLLDLSNNPITNISGTLPPKLQNLNLIKTTLSSVNFLNGLLFLQKLSISNTSALVISFSSNPLLQSIDISNSSISSITGSNILTNLVSFIATNLFITSTPDFSNSSTNLKVLQFTGCNFITSLSTISSNTNLITYIVNGSALSSSSLDLTHNTLLNTLVISNSNLITFSSLISTQLLNYIDVSLNDFLNTTVENIVQDLVSHSKITNGTLILSNQQTPINYSSLPDPFTANLNYLRNQLHWSVIL